MEASMPKYLIERTVPGAGQMDAEARRAIAEKSNGVLRDLGPDIQWIHSYVTDDSIVCVYFAANEEIIREHARCGGFPVDAVYELRGMLEPATAELVG
jgi:Nickel responsive protein SCO4226-like